MTIRLVHVLRVLGFLLGGVVALAAALTLLAWISFDASRTAGALSQYFKDHYQRTLVLGAEPQLRIWPRPALLLNKVSLSETGRGEIFASAEQVRLNLNPWPLVFKQHEILSIGLNGLDARISRKATGDWNLSNLLRAPSTEAVAPWQLKLKTLSLRDARLRIDDARSASRLEWRKVSASVERLHTAQPAPINLEGQWLDAASESDFHFTGRAGYASGSTLQSARLNDLSLRLEGNGGGLQGASAQIDSAQLGWDADGTRVVKLVIKLQGAAGPQAVNFTASAPRLAWQAERLQGEALSAQLTLREMESKTEFNLKLPQLVESPQGFSSPALEFGWQHQRGKAHGSQGKISAQLDVDLKADSARLSAVQGALSLQHPRLHSPAAQLSFGGQALWRKSGGTEATLDAKWGEDPLRVLAKLQTLWPLEGRLELSTQGLNIDRLLAEAKPGAPLPALSLPDFGAHNLSGTLKLAKLQLAGLKVDSLQGSFSMSKGLFNSKGLTAALYGGQLSGELSAEASSGRISVQSDFSELALERLAPEAELKTPLLGRLSGSSKLVTTLKADSTPLMELNGALRWTLTNSSIRGVDLIRSLREFRPAIAAGTQSARSPQAAETTELGTVSSRFVFAGGKLQAEAIQSRNSWLSLAGSGTADLLREELDFSLQASLLPGISAQAKDLAELRSKPIPLRLKGPLLHPDVRFEPSLKPAGNIKK